MDVTVTQACDGEVYDVTQVGNMVIAVTLTA